MIVCSQCKKEFETLVGNFYKNKCRTTGHDNICKTCRKEDRNERYRLRNAEIVIAEKECPTCEKSYPLTKEHWHVKNKERNYYSGQCKTCRNEMQAKYRLKKIAKKLMLQHEEEMKLEEETNNIYRKMLKMGYMEDRQQGLNFDNLKLTIGKKYSIRIPRREGSTSFEYFIGTLMQECKNHLVFKNSKGICESFLKVDLLLEHEYKEVI